MDDSLYEAIVVDCGTFEVWLTKPDSEYTPAILAALTEHYAKCLFRRESHTRLTSPEMAPEVRTLLADSFHIKI